MTVLPYAKSASAQCVHVIIEGLLTSSMYGYPKSIRARLDTRRAGIRVLPFLGYMLRIVVALLLLLVLLEVLLDRELLRRELLR